MPFSEHLNFEPLPCHENGLSEIWRPLFLVQFFKPDSVVVLDLFKNLISRLKNGFEKKPIFARFLMPKQNKGIFFQKMIQNSLFGLEQLLIHLWDG